MMDSLFAPRAMSVGELCKAIRGALRASFRGPVRVLGEVSRCDKVRGNAYFTLKDSQATIQCICFADSIRTMSVAFPLADGLACEVEGFVEIWEPKSQYQLRVCNVVPVGTGALYVAFEQLKNTLAREGLFDAARKRPIPSFIRDVAIVTSRSGAALADFMTTCRRRGAHVRVHLVGAPVQGAEAAPALARAIRAAGKLAVDVVVVARGGGSLEDLWAFNTEEVARAIAECAKPVISAVGHETDVTIADLVADKRAPTPTAAAEFVAQERTALLARIAQCERRLRTALVRAITLRRPGVQRLHADLRRAALGVLRRRKQQVDACLISLRRLDPRRRLAEIRRRATQAAARLRAVVRRCLGQAVVRHGEAQSALRRTFAAGLAARTRRLDIAVARLEALSPRQTLQRGYAIVYNAAGAPVTDSATIRVGERIGVELQRGWLGATVDDKKD
jgi:exodeoxyribonuclease VII large subunit